MTEEYKPDFTIARDRHLFGPGPKNILALDGGGVRGAITVAFLERIERILSERPGPPQKLGDYFDLVGGTSTGAIIAGAIALGKSAADIEAFYSKLAPRVFTQPFGMRNMRSRLYMGAKFDAEALRAEIEGVVQDLKLDSTELITGLCVVAKRMDTGSVWIMANNPAAPYWGTERADAAKNKKGHIGNRSFKLANLVRASTAAPTFFDPELIEIVEGMDHGLFVDGGVTPHNNPSLVLFLMSRLKPYKLCWDTGPEKLTIVSIGTGSARDQVLPSDLGVAAAGTLGYKALLSLMNDAQTLVLAQMQWLGQCPHPWSINSEWGTMDGMLPGGPFFRFLRYDVRLETAWLARELDIHLTEAQVTRLRALDDPGIIKEIYGMAKIAAQKQVLAEDWK
jgi:uncharacterized protein